MLPINRKRVLHIPHGVATVAATVCLVLAFSTDIKSRHAQIMAERAESTPVQFLAGAEDKLQDKAARADQRSESRARDSAQRSIPMPLFPSIPGLNSPGG